MADPASPFADDHYPPRPAIRIFLDTSALIAGMASSRLPAPQVLRLGEAGVIRVYLSEQVLTEADRVWHARFPALTAEFRNFLRNLDPVLVDDPTRAEVASIEGWINADEAPILAAAIMSRADCLVTWNTKYFQNRKVTENVQFQVFTPTEFLEKYFGK